MPATTEQYTHNCEYALIMCLLQKGDCMCTKKKEIVLRYILNVNSDRWIQQIQKNLLFLSLKGTLFNRL